MARGASGSIARRGRTVAEVRLDRVVKRYPGRAADALQETSLTFEQGLFTCVLGPSGSGKSTVLKLLAGIEEVTSGRIFMDGRDVTNVTPERRDVAMVFQSYGLYPNMTARDNIAFPLMLRGLKKPDRYGRVDEVARMLGIGDLLDRHPRVLSGGERQRVALGRAIVRNPKVFLLDEPISNLDANLRATTREELKRIHQQLGATFIYVTHDQDDAEAMGDRVVVMAKGAVQQVDPPATIYRRPANRFVASFVGRLPMNFIPGHIVAENERTWFASDVIRVELQTQDPPAAPGPSRPGHPPRGRHRRSARRPVGNDRAGDADRGGRSRRIRHDRRSLTGAFGRACRRRASPSATRSASPSSHRTSSSSIRRPGRESPWLPTVPRPITPRAGLAR